MRVLGIDYGSKRTGIALGDTDARIASPWSVITSTDRLEVLRKIHEFIANERVEMVVVGVPKPLTERELENDQTKEIRAFIGDLNAQGIVVHEEDEALSSRLAASQLRESGEKGKRDDVAAAAILQSWLDRNAVSP